MDVISEIVSKLIPIDRTAVRSSRSDAVTCSLLTPVALVLNTSHILVHCNESLSAFLAARCRSFLAISDLYSSGEGLSYGMER